MTELKDRGTQSVIGCSTELQCSEPTQSYAIQRRDYAKEHTDKHREKQRLIRVSGNCWEEPRILSHVFSDFICQCIPCKDSFAEEY